MSDRNALDDADYKARVFVIGLTEGTDSDGVLTGKKVLHTGNWAPRFLGHPTVEQALAEGWGRELQSTIIGFVRRRILAQVPYHDINTLMPDKEWIEHQRKNAKRYADAKAWRDPLIEQYGDISGVLTRLRPRRESLTARPLGSVMRDTIAAMQRASANRMRLHEKPAVDISSRITGDRE